MHRLSSALACVLLSIALVPAPASAHCDGLDGPVVTAARAALESGNSDSVLIWVQPDDEGEVRAAFHQAVTVRRLGSEARALATATSSKRWCDCTVPARAHPTPASSLPDAISAQSFR